MDGSGPPLTTAEQIPSGAGRGDPPTFRSLAEMMEFAQLMAAAGPAVPRYLRHNPGTCLAICQQAQEWGMSPFAVAGKSYLASNGDDEKIAFESQLVHALIEARAPLVGRLRFEIVGEGDDRRCKVWGTFCGEIEPHTYISEPLRALRGSASAAQAPAHRNPMWTTQPEVQLFYSASRQWCRLFAPDILLGIYTPEELQRSVEEPVTVAGSSLADRLRDHASGKAFSALRVAADIQAAMDPLPAPNADNEAPAIDQASPPKDRDSGLVGSEQPMAETATSTPERRRRRTRTRRRPLHHAPRKWPRP